MRRLVPLLYGVSCHGLFLAAVSSMAWSLHHGLQGAHGPDKGSWWWNGLLILQFPLLHSLALSRRGAPWLLRLAPQGLRRYLFTTLFASLSSVQLLAVFLAWSPTGVVWWRATGGWYGGATVASAACWAFLLKAMSDAGLSLQTGSQGWVAAWRRRPPEAQAFPTGGTYRLCRQPIYLAFALVLWVGPVMSLDRLVLALCWTAYCLLGPLHKEQRALRMFGSAYRAWQSQVPYFLPRPWRRSPPAAVPHR